MVISLPLILGIIPPLLWLVFFLNEDWRHPEPKRLILLLFIAGGVAAVLAILPEYFIDRKFPLAPGVPPELSPLLFPFALIEELAKFGIVYLIVRPNKYFDERVDAMIYMITAALGFAALENVLNLFGNEAIIEVALLRGIGATLLHALAAAVLGFYWAKGRIATGIIGATLLHGSFNYLILKVASTVLYPSVLLFLAAIFVFQDFEILKDEDYLASRRILPKSKAAPTTK